MADYTFTEQEISEGKMMAIISYIGFLGWLIAYLSGKENRYTLYHIQQALLSNLFIIIPPIAICVAIFGIIGIINANGGEAKPLPLIGELALKFNIFKG